MTTAQAKKIYPSETQQKILLDIPRLVIPRLEAQPSVTKAILEGCLTTGNFGVSKEGVPDDINIVVFLNGGIPREWKRAGVYREWYAQYNFADVQFYSHNGAEHALDLLIVPRNRAQRALEAIKETSGLLYLRNGRKAG